MVKSAEEHGFKTHLREKSCVNIGVTKGVDIPTNFRLNAKLLLNPLMADHHVINYVIEIWSGFVVGTPTAIDKFELAVLNQVFDNLLFFFGLSVVPHGKEAHFSIGESPVLIFG